MSDNCEHCGGEHIGLTVKNAFKLYLQKFYPKGLEPLERGEVERAFYLGAALITDSLAQLTENAPESTKAMNYMVDEICDYVAQNKLGICDQELVVKGESDENLSN